MAPGARHGSGLVPEYCFSWVTRITWEWTRACVPLCPPNHQTFVDLPVEQVSTVDTLGKNGVSSPLQADMAEQGHKARASAARLEEVGATATAASGAGNTRIFEEGDVAGGTKNGMVPLRCSVYGRCASSDSCITIKFSVKWSTTCLRLGATIFRTSSSRIGKLCGGKTLCCGKPAICFAQRRDFLLQ